MDPEEAGDIGSGATGGEHPENLGLLVCQELRTPSALSAALAGRRQTGADMRGILTFDLTRYGSSLLRQTPQAAQDRSSSEKS